MKIVAIGDSITFGDGLSTPEGNRWTDRLALATGDKVINEGVNRDTTRLALERFPGAVQQPRPGVVLIQFGFNDCNFWETDCGLPRVSRKAFRANLHEMISRAEWFGCMPILLSTYPTNKGDRYEHNRVVYDWEIVDEAESSNVPLVNLEEVSRPSGGSSVILADGIHLSNLGHARIAALVKDALP